MEKLGIIGVNIRSQNLKLLEHLTIDPSERISRLEELKTFAGLSELVYLATCNRVEFIFIRSGRGQSNDIRNRILDFFFRDENCIPFSPNDFYVKSGFDAARHLFEVASALDSLVVGEAQILGQIKDAYAYAGENKLIDKMLPRVFRHVFKVAKKVRTETDLGKRSVSMVSLVTSTIGQVIQAEGDVPVALIGVGEMTRKLAKFLIGRKIKNIIFVNRTHAKAVELMELYGGQAMSLDDFLTASPKARIVCTATSSTSPIFTTESIKELQAVNPQILFIDLALPRDVDVENNVENGIEIRNISDLKHIAEQNRRERFRDVDKAREIVSREVIRYRKETIEEQLRPVFNQSREQSHEFAASGLNRLFDTQLSHLESSDREAISRWVDKMVNYVTYQPARSIADRMVESESLDPINRDACLPGTQSLQQPAVDSSAGNCDDEQIRLFRKGA